MDRNRKENTKQEQNSQQNMEEDSEKFSKGTREINFDLLRGTSKELSIKQDTHDLDQESKEEKVICLSIPKPIERKPIPKSIFSRLNSISYISKPNVYQSIPILLDDKNYIENEKLGKRQDCDVKEKEIYHQIKSKRIKKKMNKKTKDNCQERALSSETIDKDDKRAISFEELNKALKCIFCRTTSNSDAIVLSSDERRIINAVFNKKFTCEEETVKGIHLINFYQDLIRVRKRKRCEDLYKFVLKSIFRYLQNKYETTNLVERQKISLEERKKEFFSFYFKKTAIRLNKPLLHFYLPLASLNRGAIGKEKLSTKVNLSYINLILQSSLFKAEFIEFINNKMVSYCKETIATKIDKLVNKWEKSCIENEVTYREIERICLDIKFNKKCKFPWTISEVEYARTEMIKLLTKITKDKY